MRLSLAFLGCLLPGVASAWESNCFMEDAEFPFSPRVCEDGYEKARYRWVPQTIGPPWTEREVAEHATLTALGRLSAGLPESTGDAFSLTTLSDGSLLGYSLELRPFYAMTPVRADPKRIVDRVLTVDEMAQLPDHAYSLADWATGLETCPISSAIDPKTCHTYQGWVAALNSSHFVPQTRYFYAHYHALAEARADECFALSSLLVDVFDENVLLCEKEALVLEAIGQHYLQDAWSMGHMWERWGGPVPSDWPEVGTALLVGAASGIFHGTKAITDWDDPMCAPPPTDFYVEYVDAYDGAVRSGVGDVFLPMLTGSPTYAPQAEALLSCSADGFRQVYERTGQRHGPMSSGPSWVDPLRSVDDEAACWGARATNATVALGSRLHVGTYPDQWDATGSVTDVVMLTMLRVKLWFADVEVPSESTSRFNRDLASARLVADLEGAKDPYKTDLASGWLGEMLDTLSNKFYVRTALGDPASPPAFYVDPEPSWGPEAWSGDSRAEPLHLQFQAAHADERCTYWTADDLADFRADAYEDDSTDPSELDADVRKARVELCKQMVGPHVRVGRSGAYDTALEPLCTYIDPASPIVYSGDPDVATKPVSRADALDTYCAGSDLINDGGFEASSTATPWLVAGVAELTTGLGPLYPPYAGSQMANVRRVAGKSPAWGRFSQPVLRSPLPKGTYHLSYQYQIYTNENNRTTDTAVVNPWFVVRLDDGGPTGGTILEELDPAEWYTSVSYYGGSWYTSSWTSFEADITVAADVTDPYLTFQVGSGYPYSHYVLVDEVSFTDETPP